MVTYLDSQAFKGIVDYMTVEEIFAIWSNFDDAMNDKFFAGLTDDDIANFTPAEW